MPKLSKKLRDIWEFFIDPNTKRRKYYPRCCRCARNCKQSFRVTGLWCPRYEPKTPEIRPLSTVKRVGNIMTYPVHKTSLAAKETAENGTLTAVKKHDKGANIL